MRFTIELISEIHGNPVVAVNYQDSDTGTNYSAKLTMVGNTANWDKELPEPIMDFAEAYMRAEF